MNDKYAAVTIGGSHVVAVVIIHPRIVFATAATCTVIIAVVFPLLRLLLLVVAIADCPVPQLFHVQPLGGQSRRLVGVAVQVH